MAGDPGVRVRKLNIKQKKKVIKSSAKIRGGFRLLGSALKHIWANKRVFGLLLIVYLVLYILLVKGLASGFNLDETRQTLEETGESTGGLYGASSMLGALVGSVGSTSSESSGVYQSILFIIMSLAIIWTLRQTFDGRKQVGLREVFYKSMSPFIPYILVGIVILLQLVPALIGIAVYGIVVGGGIAVSFLEQVLWFVLLILSLGTSVYLVSSSVLASYIVTLPDMTPSSALRSAKKLVRFKRFIIIRRLLFLLFAVAISVMLIFLPMVVFLPLLAEACFIVFSLFLIMVVHAYFYVLYREML